MNIVIKWLVAIYILSMLAWSSFVKAETSFSTPLIKEIHFDPNHYEMMIHGQFDGLCDLSLETRVIENQFTEDSPVVLLEIVPQKSSTPCIEGLYTEFHYIFDLRGLGLKSGITYEFTFANPILFEPSPLFMVEIPQNTALYRNHIVKSSGQLMKSLTGEWFIVRGDVRDVLVKSRIDLDRYIGKNVVIEGTKHLHRTDPAIEARSYNPLRSPGPSAESETMFLFSIRSETI